MSKQTRNMNLAQKAGKLRKKSPNRKDKGKKGVRTGKKPLNSLHKQGKHPKGQTKQAEQQTAFSTKNWIWGTHAVTAALKNPKRTYHSLLITNKMASKLDNSLLSKLKSSQSDSKIQITDMATLDKYFANAAHQGIALKCAPLADTAFEDIIHPAEGLIIVLDQITDPHNVGAIFRLAAAFGAKAIIMQKRHAPPLTGATAKVAVGMVETVPHILVTNIANSLLKLKKSGWRVTGLAGETELELEQALTNAHAEVLVMGAEGPGLRKRVRDCCDQLARIPMSAIHHAESLNVATATGIALYEANKKLNQSK